jgi:sodium bicarbonate cotransporter 5
MLRASLWTEVLGTLSGLVGVWVAWKQTIYQESPDPFPPLLVLQYNPLNLTALDWSLLSKKECLSYGGRLLGNSCQFIPDLALMSFILFFGTYSMTLTLKKFKFSRYFPTKVSRPYLFLLR